MNDKVPIVQLDTGIAGFNQVLGGDYRSSPLTYSRVAQVQGRRRLSINCALP